MNDQFLQRFAPGSHRIATPGLRAIVNRSVGIGAAPVARADHVEARAGQDQDAARIAAAVARSFGALAQRLDQVTAAVDRAAVAQQTRPAVDPDPDPYAQLQRSTYRLPLPVTGALPAPSRVVNMPATTVQGAANAMVQQLRGPQNQPDPEQKAYTRTGQSVRSVVRRSVGLNY